MSGVLRVAMVSGSVSLALLIDYLMSRANVRYAPGIGGAMVIAFLATQVGVCATWVAVGGGPSLVQLVASVALSFGVWQFLRTWNERALDEFGPGLMSEAATVLVVLVAMRLWRFRMLGTVADDPTHSTGGSVPRYSIRDVMVGTALVSVALATIVRMQTMRVDRDASEISTVVGRFLGAMTLLSFFSTLAFRRAVIPAAITCAASVYLGWSVGKAVRYDQVVSIVAIAAPAAMQLTLFMLVRFAGYRFERTESVGVAQPASDYYEG